MFRRDMEMIAEEFALNAMRLLQAMRRADALAAFEQAESERTDGLLAAARDREPGEVDPGTHDGRAHGAHPDESDG